MRSFATGGLYEKMVSPSYELRVNGSGHYVFEISDQALARLVQHVLQVYDGRVEFKLTAPLGNVPNLIDLDDIEDKNAPQSPRHSTSPGLTNNESVASPNSPAQLSTGTKSNHFVRIFDEPDSDDGSEEVVPQHTAKHEKSPDLDLVPTTQATSSVTTTPSNTNPEQSHRKHGAPTQSTPKNKSRCSKPDEVTPTSVKQGTASNAVELYKRPMSLREAAPKVLSGFIKHADRETRDQVKHIACSGWINEGKDTVIVNPMRSGIKEALAFAMLTDFSKPHCHFVWLCPNTVSADMISTLMLGMEQALSELKVPCRKMVLLAGYTEPKDVQAAASIIKTRPSVIVAVEARFMGLHHKKLIDIDAVSKFILDGANLLLSNDAFPHTNSILSALQPHHVVVPLISDMHRGLLHDWARSGKHLKKDLEFMPRLPGNDESMLRFLLDRTEWIELRDPRSRVQQLEVAIKQYLTGEEKNIHHGQRRVLALCDAATLRSLVSRRNSNAGGSCLFDRDISVAHSDLPKKTIDNALYSFKQGTTEVLFTTPRFIYGATWEFLPKLFVVHVPGRFDEWLTVLQWYMHLFDRMGVRPQANLSPHAIGPSVQVLYRPSEKGTATHHQRLLKTFAGRA